MTKRRSLPPAILKQEAKKERRKRRREHLPFHLHLLQATSMKGGPSLLLFRLALNVAATHTHTFFFELRHSNATCRKHYNLETQGRKCEYSFTWQLEKRPRSRFITDHFFFFFPGGGGCCMPRIGGGGEPQVPLFSLWKHLPPPPPLSLITQTEISHAGIG